MSANMFSQRAMQLAARRLTTTHPSTLSRLAPLTKLSGPAAVATSRHLQYRPATTSTITSPSSILERQRLARPVSPHLTIYRPQITWIGSSLNRITGVYLSGALYVFGLAYLAAPYIGWHLDSASLAAGFAAWPILAKVLTKFTFALPFTYHSWNGIRHLVWDSGAAFTNKQVIVTGWTVVGVSVLTALGLTFY